MKLRTKAFTGIVRLNANNPVTWSIFVIWSAECWKLYVGKGHNGPRSEQSFEVYLNANSITEPVSSCVNLNFIFFYCFSPSRARDTVAMNSFFCYPFRCTRMVDIGLAAWNLCAHKNNNKIQAVIRMASQHGAANRRYESLCIVMKIIPRWIRFSPWSTNTIAHTHTLVLITTHMPHCRQCDHHRGKLFNNGYNGQWSLQ